MLLKSGTYTGNGVDDRSITGIGFGPDCVFIWRNNAGSKIFRTSDGFTGDQSSTFGSTTATFTNGIQALESDGFQVGTHAQVNANTFAYHYLAVKDDGNSDFAVGSYTGDGTDDRDITVGFQPKYVVVKGLGGSTNAEMHIASMATDEAWTIGSGTLNADTIQDVGATTFRVGTSAQVNSNTVSYVWVAFGFGDSNTYTGNGADDRSITGVGFDPEFLVIKEDGASTDREKVDAITDEETLKFESATHVTTNEIQQFVTDGFEVGTDTDVNDNTVGYFYFATKTNPVSAAKGAGPFTVQGGHGIPIGPYSFSAKSPATPGGKGTGPFTVQGGHGFSIGPYSFLAKTPAVGVAGPTAGSLGLMGVGI